MIADDIRLSKALYEVLEAEPDFEAVTQGLSITTFRYVPEDMDGESEESREYLDKLNDLLLTRLKDSGEVFFSNAVVGGRTLMRACIVNFRTSLSDVQAIPTIVRPHAEALDRAMRTHK